MADPNVRLLVDRYRAGWFGHDVDAIMAVVADDIVFDNLTAGERVEGAAAFRAHVAGIHAGPISPSRSTRSISQPIREWRNGRLGRQLPMDDTSSGTGST